MIEPRKTNEPIKFLDRRAKDPDIPVWPVFLVSLIILLVTYWGMRL